VDRCASAVEVHLMEMPSVISTSKMLLVSWTWYWIIVILSFFKNTSMHSEDRWDKAAEMLLRSGYIRRPAMQRRLQTRLDCCKDVLISHWPCYRVLRRAHDFMASPATCCRRRSVFGLFVRQCVRVCLKPMADGSSFLYKKLVRESWYKNFVRVS